MPYCEVSPQVPHASPNALCPLQSKHKTKFLVSARIVHGPGGQPPEPVEQPKDRASKVLGDAFIPISRDLIRVLDGDLVAAGMLTMVTKLSYGLHEDAWVSVTDQEWADALGCKPKTISRKRQMLAAYGLRADDKWSWSHNEPHVNRYRVDIHTLLQAMGRTLGELFDQRTWPDWAQDEPQPVREPVTDFLSKVDKLSAYCIERDPIPYAVACNAGIDSAKTPTSSELENNSAALQNVPPSATQMVDENGIQLKPARVGRASYSLRRTRSKTKVPQGGTRSEAEVSLEYLGLDHDTHLYWPFRDEAERFVGCVYGEDVLPARRDLAHVDDIKRFLKTYCQDPYVKAPRLDPTIIRELKFWLSTRPGLVYKADLELIRDHFSIIRASRFLFVLTVVLEKRKAAVQAKKRETRTSAEHLCLPDPATHRNGSSPDISL